jgi:hypothetical protein
MALMLDPNQTATLWHAASYPATTTTGLPTTTTTTTTKPPPSTKASYLPWLLGAGALAYLIFFRKKG